MGRVLVVNESVLLGRAIARALRGVGPVAVASRRAEALRFVGHQRFDVAVVGLVVDVDDGEAIVRALLDASPGCVGFVVFVGHTTPRPPPLRGVAVPNLLLPAADVGAIERVVRRLAGL